MAVTGDDGTDGIYGTGLFWSRLTSRSAVLGFGGRAGAANGDEGIEAVEAIEKVVSSGAIDKKKELVVSIDSVDI